jgi:bifunctional UDP-N-acetylglucosamine pyrophosphorylase / glucosamine-1-phosphate N-acetyltransferase
VEILAQLNRVILAAGKGTRMVSKLPKIAHPVMGKPMVRHVVETAGRLGPGKTIVVTGHERKVVEACLADTGVDFAVQTEQKGTAHAVLTAEELLGHGDILVLYGDVPLIRTTTLEAFTRYFTESEGIVFMTTDVDRPDGYGRVLVGPEGDIIDIVEDADATAEIRKICTINTGICMIRRDLLSLVKEVKADNNKGEYYLTDICKVARGKGIPVMAWHHPNAGEVLGINTRKELLAANLAMRNDILDHHMRAGVTIADRSVYIESDVVIGRDTTILPYSFIAGRTEIGEDATIGPHVTIRNSTIGNGATINSFVCLDGAAIEERGQIGPYQGKKTNHPL